MKKYRARRYRRYQVDNFQSRRYRRYRKRRAWVRGMGSVLALILVLAGLGLVGYSLMLGEDSLLPRAISNATNDEELAASAPKDTTLWLSIPRMARVEDLPVYDAPWDDEAALDASAGHLDSSGFPWEEGANVYIAGHRMGFPGTKSFLVFYDLDVLENGDEIVLADGDGTKYTYKVFDKFVSDPYDWAPTEPIPGKSIVTLQTCTLPDYTERLIVQAELTKVEPGESGTRRGADPEQKAEPASVDPTQEVGPVPVDQIPVEPVPESFEPVPIEPLPGAEPAQIG